MTFSKVEDKSKKEVYNTVWAYTKEKYMEDFDENFFSSNTIELQTLDDVDEYMSTVDLWLTMHDGSEVAVTGSEEFGYYALHTFDEPVQITTPDGDIIDSFEAAVVYESPGLLQTRETYSFTFPTQEQATTFFERMKEEFYKFSLDTDKEEYTDLGELREGGKQ